MMELKLLYTLKRFLLILDCLSSFPSPHPYSWGKRGCWWEEGLVVRFVPGDDLMGSEFVPRLMTQNSTDAANE